MPTKLTGLPSFAYLGVEAPQPPNMIQVNRAPTTTDVLTYNTGDLWLNNAGLSLVPQVLPTAADIWMLVSKQRNIGVWVNFGGGGGNMRTLTGDNAVAVPPNGVGNTNIFGTANNITVIGNAGTNTLTLNTGAHVATTYNGDVGAAIPAAGVLNIISNVATQNSGSSVSFSGAGSTLTLNVTDANGNTIIGTGSGNAAITGTNNTLIGKGIGHVLTTGGNNCVIGQGALAAAQATSSNMAIGTSSLQSLVNGNGSNTAVGNSTLQAYTGGGGGLNTVIGYTAGFSLLTGSNNVFIGQGAANALNGAESNNIIIGPANGGVVGESNKIRIQSGIAGITATFIDGIRGVTTANMNAVAVLIDSAGQLGTVSSSKRYKENIQDMEDASELIMDLRPVVFNYKKHPDVLAWGLIAEEVAEVFPQLVVYDKEGQCETVKYHELSILLLNELQKVSKRIEELEIKLNE